VPFRDAARPRPGGGCRWQGADRVRAADGDVGLVAAATPVSAALTRDQQPFGAPMLHDAKAPPTAGTGPPQATQPFAPIHRPMPEGAGGKRPGENFQEAIARWQHKLQTEVRKTSSLPTAMFDACDPMLEAKLAETTEGIFTWLLNHGPPSDQQQKPQSELHLEMVAREEIAACIRQVLSQPPPTAPLLDDNAIVERLGVLVDACCTGDPAVQKHAARHLCREFEIVPETDVGLLTQQLQECFAVALTGDEAAAAAVEATSMQLAAAVTQAITRNVFREAPP